MYARNNASPERIAIGQVILIADGTVQTSGVSIVVRPQAGAEAAGGGTTAYGADGTVYYTPTQAETNYTSFVVIAYKASCFSVSQTIITTASATTGKVVLSGETHTGAVVPTVSTLTGHTAQTGDTYALANGSAGFVAIDTVVDGIQTDLSNATDGLGAIKTAVDSRMAEASINTTAGAVDNVTLVATTTTNTDMRGTDSAATAASLATAQTDLDTITGTDGVTLAAAQALYAPAKAGDNMGTVTSVTGAVGSVTGNVGGNVVGSVGSNLELGPAEVNAEVVDALATDTYAEPGQGAPAATNSLAAKINYLFKAWRNKTEQTATTLSLYDDAGTTVDQKSTVSDDTTTATKGEIVSGP